jgi:hypothetical protein
MNIMLTECSNYTSTNLRTAFNKIWDHGKENRLRTCVRDISPYKARASVLGIGVADMART